MRARSTLLVPGIVSEKLLRNADRARDILASFSDGELGTMRIVAPRAPTPSTPGRGVGSFFSAGVDSFYTALKRNAELTHLVFVEGFDVFDATSRRGIAAADGARAAAAALGKELIEVETNLRELTESFAIWHLAHGIGLAAVGLLLQNHLERIFIPASYSYGDLGPWGTHPLLDPLWSTEALEFVHDGCELVRAEKVAVIADSETALKYLRVCNRQNATYNCGRCEKCVRTMLNLRLAGALERCATLPSRVTYGQVASLQTTGRAERVSAQNNLKRARKTQDWPMVVALSVALRPRPILGGRRRLGRLRREWGSRARTPASSMASGGAPPTSSSGRRR
jgi:hypothetical protein